MATAKKGSYLSDMLEKSGPGQGMSSPDPGIVAGEPWRDRNGETLQVLSSSTRTAAAANYRSEQRAKSAIQACA